MIGSDWIIFGFRFIITKVSIFSIFFSKFVTRDQSQVHDGKFLKIRGIFRIYTDRQDLGLIMEITDFCGFYDLNFEKLLQNC